MINLKFFKLYSMEFLTYDKNKIPILINVPDRELEETEVLYKEYKYHISSKTYIDKKLTLEELKKIIEINPNSLDLHLAIISNFEYKIENDYLVNEYHSILISSITEIYQMKHIKN